MILVDFNQQLVASVNYLQNSNIDINQQTLQHTVLNYIFERISKINSTRAGKFASSSEDIILCCDGGNYWRRSIYPYYKIKRKESRSKSKLDWQAIFELSPTIKSNISDYTGIKVLEIPTVEADDIISVLVKRLHSNNKLCIFSTDQDFLQLQYYPNIYQYSITTNGFIKPSENAINSLVTKLLEGDRGDGVPNILSDDDIFVNGNRQTPITKSKRELLFNNISSIVLGKSKYRDTGLYSEDNLIRNNGLMNLINAIPDYIENMVIECYNKNLEHKCTLEPMKKLDYYYKNGYDRIADSHWFI